MIQIEDIVGPMKHRGGEPELDVIMPTHGRLELTIFAINALYANTQASFHLIIVDDSDDLTPQYLEKLQKEKDNITFIHSTTPFKNGNQFFNKAFEYTKTDYIATIMNSVRVEPEWEIVALDLMKRDPKIGIIGFKNLLPNGSIESAGIAMYGHTPVDLGRDLPAHRLCGCYEVPAAQWAFAMLRKQAVVGVLDDTLFHGFVGWDDIDNCFVVRDKGWKILYCGMGAGYHSPRATRGSDEADAQRKNQENAHVFYKRWGYWEQFCQATGYKEPEQKANTILEQAEAILEGKQP